MQMIPHPWPAECVHDALRRIALLRCLAKIIAEGRGGCLRRKVAS